MPPAIAKFINVCFMVLTISTKYMVCVAALYSGEFPFQPKFLEIMNFNILWQYSICFMNFSDISELYKWFFGIESDFNALHILHF